MIRLIEAMISCIDCSGIAGGTAGGFSSDIGGGRYWLKPI
jgi:hypothetical protein